MPLQPSPFTGIRTGVSDSDNLVEIVHFNALPAARRRGCAVRLLSPVAETLVVAEQLRERITKMFRRSLQIRHLDAVMMETSIGRSTRCSTRSTTCSASASTSSHHPAMLISYSRHRPGDAPPRASPVGHIRGDAPPEAGGRCWRVRLQRWRCCRQLRDGRRGGAPPTAVRARAVRHARKQSSMGCCWRWIEADKEAQASGGSTCQSSAKRTGITRPMVSWLKPILTNT